MENITMGEKIKMLRTQHGLTLEQVAQKVGVGKSTVRKWETGMIANMKRDKISVLAEALHTTPAYLMGWDESNNPTYECPDDENPWEVELRDAFDKLDLDSQISLVEQAKIMGIKNINPLPKHKKIPLLGTIACGEPIFAEENLDGYTLCPEDVEADFCLRCKGDSMIGARIQDGDIVYIKQQQTIENGEIAAVLIDDEATLKRVYKKGDSLILQPENPAYEPLIFVREEMNEIRILGKAVCFLSKVR